MNSSLIVFWILLAIILILLVLIVYIYTNHIRKKEVFNIACAGSLTSNAPTTREFRGFDWAKFKGDDGSSLSPKDYTVFIVKGFSMLLGGIRSGDALFVEKAKTNPVEIALNYPAFIVLKRGREDIEKAEEIGDNAMFKVRRAWFEVSYPAVGDDEICVQIEEIVDSEYFEKLREKGRSLYGVEFPEKQELVDDFRENHLKPFKEKAKGKSGMAIISSTYDTQQNRVHFSIHPKEMLVGEVKYAFDIGGLPSA